MVLGTFGGETHPSSPDKALSRALDKRKPKINQYYTTTDRGLSAFAVIIYVIEFVFGIPTSDTQQRMAEQRP